MVNRIVKLKWNFIWGGLGDEPKFHLVKWANVCTPLSLSGLGIRKVKFFNEVFCLGSGYGDLGLEGMPFGGK